MSVLFVYPSGLTENERKKREEAFVEFAKEDARLQEETNDWRNVTVDRENVINGMLAADLSPGTIYVLYSVADIDMEDIGYLTITIQYESRCVFVREPWLDTDIYLDYEISSDLAYTFFETTCIITRRGKDRDAERSRKKRREGQLRRAHPGAPHGKRTPSYNEIECWRIIYWNSRYFKGKLTNSELMGPEYCGIAKNTFYLYKQHLTQFLAQGGDLSSATVETVQKYQFT